MTLRDEADETDARHLSAYLDDKGDLHIDRSEPRAGTAIVSSDGEYEWYRNVAAADVSRVVELLGGGPDDDVLERDWTGDRSYHLEARLSAGAQAEAALARSLGVGTNAH